MEKLQILAIDDDSNFSKILSQYFGDDGHKIHTAYTGRDALNILVQECPDIVLLDMVLPDIDGLALMGEIRKRTRAPVIVISGKGAETDRVVGLEMGADDYITKPFPLRELSARIKAILRRSGRVQDKEEPAAEDPANVVFHFNGWRMDTAKHDVFDPAGRSANLTAGEFDLLKIFLEAPNRALSRDYLFDATRGSNFDTFDRTIDVQVNRLRRKLKDDPLTPALIKTVRGVGYMFIGNVKKEVAGQTRQLSFLQ